MVNIKDIDTIVVDPPRKGCEKKFLDTIIKMKIRKIIYISCLTQSLARDAKYLSEFGYQIDEVTLLIYLVIHIIQKMFAF